MLNAQMNEFINPSPAISNQAGYRELVNFLSKPHFCNCKFRTRIPIILVSCAFSIGLQKDTPSTVLTWTQ